MSTDSDTIAGESVDLLSQLIRNQCVNDGTADSGFESRSVDADRAVPRRHRPRPRALRGATRTREPRRADRRQRPDRADAAAHGPHRRRAREPRRLAARSVRRRARRRRDLGPRRGRHVEPHRHDGGRVPRTSPRSGFTPRGTLVVSRGRRRGEPRHLGRGASARARARRGDGRLRRHRGRRLPAPARARARGCP